MYRYPVFVTLGFAVASCVNLMPAQDIKSVSRGVTTQAIFNGTPFYSKLNYLRLENDSMEIMLPPQSKLAREGGFWKVQCAALTVTGKLEGCDVAHVKGAKGISRAEISRLISSVTVVAADTSVARAHSGDFTLYVEVDNPQGRTNLRECGPPWCHWEPNLLAPSQSVER